MTSPQDLQARFREAITQFLWDQWVSIGVAGTIPGAERAWVGSDYAGARIPFIVDPEALLLATTRFASEDSRLMGEVLDWLKVNSKSISFARIKTLQKTHGSADVRVLKSISEFLRDAGDKSWDTLKPLFGDTSGKPHAITSRLRGMSAAPAPSNPTCFLFKMRSLFGMTARAEIITWLLTHDSGHPAAIARESAWFSKTAQSVLNELERSGHVFSIRRGREKVFNVLHSEWVFFASHQWSPAGWFCQAEFYQACASIDLALSGICSNSTSDEAHSILIREHLSVISDGLARSGVSERSFVPLKAQRGTKLVQNFAEEVSSLIQLRLDERKLPVHTFKSD